MKNKPGKPSAKTSRLAKHNESMAPVTEQATKEAQNKKISGSGKTKEKSSGLLFRELDKVKSKPVEWLWPGFIAIRKVTLIAGHPGLGKSQLTAYIAGIVTTGGCWPIERTKSDQGRVLFLSAEDDAADTIVPRLNAVNADLGQCVIVDGYRHLDTSGRYIQRSFNLKDDLERLENKVNELGNVRLIIIDPVSAYLGGIDSHKNADVRALLSELGEFAQKNNLSILCVSHLNKSNNQDALSRVNGSGAFVAAARAAFLVAKDQNKPDRRYFVPLKNNLAKDGIGLAFSISSCLLDNGIETSNIEWEPEPINITADEVLSETPKRKDNGALETAKRFLIEFLGDEWKLVNDIMQAAKESGHSAATIRRAKEDLGIKPQREDTKGRWFWGLFASENFPHAQVPYYKNEHLEQGRDNKGISTCSSTPHAQHNMNEHVGKNKMIFNEEQEEIIESVL